MLKFLIAVLIRLLIAVALYYVGAVALVSGIIAVGLLMGALHL